MYSFLSRKGTMVAFALGAIITLIFVAVVMSNAESLGSFSDDKAGLDALKAKHIDTFDIGIFSAVGMTIITFIIALAFGLIQMLSNIKGSMKMLIGVGVLIVLYFIFANTAVFETSGPISETLKEFNISEGTNKIIEGAIKTTGAAGIIAIIALVVLEVYNLFK